MIAARPKLDVVPCEVALALKVIIHELFQDVLFHAHTEERTGQWFCKMTMYRRMDPTIGSNCSDIGALFLAACDARKSFSKKPSTSMTVPTGHQGFSGGQ